MLNLCDKTTLRVNIRISKNIKKWFEVKSSETGISQSSLMAMALGEYVDQKTSLETMGQMENFLLKIEELKNRLDESQHK